MNISVVIPTINRPENLRLALASILTQSMLPLEIIIIDQSDSKVTKNMLDNEFIKHTKVQFIYIHSPIKSLTKSRNIGIQQARGEIISFFDDDIELEEDYLKVVHSTFESHDAVLVGGCITNWHRKRGLIPNLFNTFFALSRIDQRFIVQPSINPTEDYSITNIVPSQWASGCNHSFLRSKLPGFSFDEQLIMYSLAEDVDFTYRVHKKYPGQCFITPFARLQHHETPNSRIPNIKRLYMDAIHKRYLFYKLFEPSLNNRFKFILSRFGYIVKETLFAFRRGESLLKALKVYLFAETYAIRHRKTIIKKDLSFFHKFLNM